MIMILVKSLILFEYFNSYAPPERDKYWMIMNFLEFMYKKAKVSEENIRRFRAI